MSLKTQGTQLYFIDPDTDEVITVGCTTSIDKSGGDNNVSTSFCLDSYDPTVHPGTRNPVQLTVGINFDPSNAAHVRLHELLEASPPEKTYWAYGLSDGTDAPTVGSEGFDFPTDRTFYSLYGFVSDLPNNISGNAVVTGTLTLTCDTCILVPAGS